MCAAVIRSDNFSCRSTIRVCKGLASFKWRESSCFLEMIGHLRARRTSEHPSGARPVHVDWTCCVTRITRHSHDVVSLDTNVATSSMSVPGSPRRVAAKEEKR